MKYYFLVTYLPEIHRDDRKIKLSFGDILKERDHIAQADWRDIELLLIADDIFLLERLLSGKDPEAEYAYYGKQFWKEQIKAPKELPAFLDEFLKNVISEEFGPGEVNALYGIFYEYAVEKANSPLLRDYFLFEKELKNILAAIRARNLGFSPAAHLLGSGERVEQLGRSNADDFGLGQEVPWIDRLLNVEDPLLMEDTVEQIRWDFLEERIQQKNFEFEVVLAYLLKLQLLEKRLALSEEQGMEIVRELEGL